MRQRDRAASFVPGCSSGWPPCEARPQRRPVDPRALITVIAVAAALLIPGALKAQHAVGTVRDSASEAPIPGAVVTLTDSAGRVSRQLLTDGHGRFTVPADVRWARLRVTRIGFSPVVVGYGPTTHAVVDVRMVPITIMLDTIRASTPAICGLADASGNTAAALWDQARAALLANVVARRAIPATAVVVGYHFVFDSLGLQELNRRTTHRSGNEQRPFGAAASASELSRTGYVIDGGGTREYLAPDADVLLDPRFSANHCFDVTLDRDGHPDQVGLAFRPAQNANSRVVDVAGTVWLDAGHPALRTIAFHYVNLEHSAEQAGAGGELQFTTMRNGVIALTRWSLTAPVVAQQERHWGGGAVGVHDHVVQVDRMGGLLASATWPDGVTWQGSVGTVTGRVVRGDPPVAAAGAQVWLESTDDTATTDSAGIFHLPAVLPGRYRLRARDPALADFDVDPGVGTDVVVKAGEDSVRVPSLTSYSQIKRSVCGTEHRVLNSALLFGQLMTTDGPPTWPADVNLTWPEVGASANAHQRVEPQSHGRFYVCGVPRGRVVSLQVRRDSVVWLDTVVTAPRAPIGVLSLPLAKRGGG